MQSLRPRAKAGIGQRLSREAALQAWKHIALALAQSDSLDDRKLARQIIDFVKDMPMLRTAGAPAREAPRAEPQLARTRTGPDRER